MTSRITSIILPALSLGGIVFLIIQNRKRMEAENRLAAVNESNAKSLAGIGRDFAKLTEQVRSNTVTEATLAQAEAGAAALKALDESRPDEDQADNGGDSTNAGNGDASTEQPL